MKKLSPLLCIALAVVVMTTVFRPGYRIVVNGRALPGIYDPKLTMQCSSAAIRAAEEITRTHEEPPYTLVPVLCLRHTQADEQQLRGILLDSYEGVVKLYRVSLDGNEIGTVSALRELYRIKGEFFPVWSPDTQLTIEEIYTYPEAETPAEEVRAAFRRLSHASQPV